MSLYRARVILPGGGAPPPSPAAPPRQPRRAPARGQRPRQLDPVQLGPEFRVAARAVQAHNTGTIKKIPSPPPGGGAGGGGGGGGGGANGGGVGGGPNPRPRG